MTSILFAQEALSDECCKVYHQTHTHELDSIVTCIVSLVKENKPPCKVKKTNRGRKLVCICLLNYRRKAMNEFDNSIYRWRGMIEAIFGAESNKNKLMTRFRKKENQERWGIIIAIGWNLKVLNRLRCRKNLGMEVKSIIRN